MFLPLFWMNPSLPTIFLTGFTGVLGKRYAYALAKAGYQVICPIRAGSISEAQERLTKTLHSLSEFIPQFDLSVEKLIFPVIGNVREKNLGVPSDSLEKLRQQKIIGVWHLAALLDLTESNSQDVYETNLVGTLHVIDFVKNLKIPELHYFSTFGSSGKVHEGIIREIVGIRPPSFRNTYERTKWEAERQVWQAMVRGELLATIYRPSIVVGDSILGRYEQFNVFNHPFDIATRVRTKLCEKQGIDPHKTTLKHDVRIPGSPDATLNIVPLDYVIDVTMRIFAIPTSRGRVYHITNPHPPKLSLAMYAFQKGAPWEGLRWERIPEGAPYLNPHEKFIDKQLGFLKPYLQGEGTYDTTQVQTVLAQHGGVPELRNEVFLEAIVRRGFQHGWQEVSPEKMAAAMVSRESLDADFSWPEGSGSVVDFSPHHPLGGEIPQASPYSLTERLIGKTYRAIERVKSSFRFRSSPSQTTGNRDLVLVPFGMGATRRGEGERFTYSYAPKLSDEVFARVNTVAGFDLRAFSREPIPHHASFGHIHDHFCHAFADDLILTLRMLKDLRFTGSTGWIQRLQILPHSGGTHLAGWLSGALSFQDALLLTSQCGYLIAESERLSALKEFQWWTSTPSSLSETERRVFKDLVSKLDPAVLLQNPMIQAPAHGGLELVFCLNPQSMTRLIREIEKEKIQVALAIQMSPHSAVFAGNAVGIVHLQQHIAQHHKLEIRRLSAEVQGSPHSSRLQSSHRAILNLLEFYLRQGRLRNPVVPVASYDGHRIRTAEEFAEALAGVGSKLCLFDQMIRGTLQDGGRHFFLLQSGLSDAAGDFFDGIIHRSATDGGFPTVQIYRPDMSSKEVHPMCQKCDARAEPAELNSQESHFDDLLRWYEQQLASLN